MAIRVLLCNAHPLVRAGLRTVLADEPDLEVVGEFADGPRAAESLGTLHPSVIVADIPCLTRRQRGGRRATGRLVEAARQHGVPAMVLAERRDLGCAARALRAGATGFLLRDDPPEQIVYGIRVVAAGQAILSPTVTTNLIATFVTASPDDPGPVPDIRAVLTPREVEVLQLLATGATVARIAESLFVAEVTVRSHIHHMLRKLGLDRTFQAVALAYHAGLVNPVSTAVEYTGELVNHC